MLQVMCCLETALTERLCASISDSLVATAGSMGSCNRCRLLLEDWQNPTRPQESGLTDVGFKDKTSY